MGSKFPASKVTEQIVKEYRQHEREKMHKCLDEYMNLCSEQKVHFLLLFKTTFVLLEILLNSDWWLPECPPLSSTVFEKTK